MTTELEPEVIDAVEVLPRLIPEQELAAIGATNAALKQLNDRAASYATLVTIDDKATYDEIHKFVMVAVKVRTGAEALAKKMAQPLKDQYQAIINEGKRIGSEAEKAEALVRPLKEAYETEQERQREEAKRLQAAKVQSRTIELVKLGAVCDGVIYTLGEATIGVIDVQAAPDERFAELLQPLQEEAARRELVKQQQAAEAIRIANEQKAEADRLEKQRLEQVAAQAELLKQQQELQRQQAEMSRMVLESRKARLVGLGWTPGTNRVCYATWVASNESLIALNSEEFETYVAEFCAYKAQRDQQIEAERIAAEQQAEADRIAKEKQAEADRVYAEQLAAETARLEKERIAQEAADLKAKQRADKERTKRLASDKTMIASWIKNMAIAYNPGTKQPETTAFVNQFNEELLDLCERYNQMLPTV